MQSVPRQIKFARLGGYIEVRQGESNPIQLVATYLAGVASLIEPPKSSMAKRPDHRMIIPCSGTLINSNRLQLGDSSHMICCISARTSSTPMGVPLWSDNQILRQFASKCFTTWAGLESLNYLRGGSSRNRENRLPQNRRERLSEEGLAMALSSQESPRGLSRQCWGAACYGVERFLPSLREVH